MAVTYPLKVSANSRYLVDQNNVPFLVIGEDAYSLISGLSNSDIDLYLANRQAKGFNLIWVTLIDALFCTNPPADLAGDQPFTGAGKLRERPRFAEQRTQIILRGEG